VSGELGGELLFQASDLLVEAAERGHQGAHDLAVGCLDWLGGGQLRCDQPIVDGHHPGLQVALPASADQRPPDGRPGEPATLLGGGRQLQDGKGLRLGQLGAEGSQRPRTELAQRAPQ
jgi:hypothetical protein